MRSSGIGMVFDRALSPELLDVALRVATTYRGSPDARKMLTVALRDHVTAQEAEGKTKKILTHIWVVPPEAAESMIDWAIDHQETAGDQRALHFAAILATFPFAGVVAAIVGRQLRLEAQVDPGRVRAEARSTLGDRSTIDVGARKVLTTMRHLGLLNGPDGGPLAAGHQPCLSPSFGGWLLHALLLTRRVEAIGSSETTRAAELATLRVVASEATYPLLELHAQNGESVAVGRKPDG